MTQPRFDLVVKSTILRGEKANKGLDAQQAPNEHTMNRVIGYLADGKKVAIAKRPGKGGVDFTKLLGGKVYAVAADGTSPVFEKDEKGQPTKIQKMEDGLPLFSSSGFYLLSSKEYPALKIGEYYSLLREQGSEVVLVSEEQIAATQRFQLESELDLGLLETAALEALDDKHNLVAEFDGPINRKRNRAITDAINAAQDEDEEYEGAKFVECQVSKRDGNPALVLFWQVEGQPMESILVLRETMVMSAKENLVPTPLSAEDAWNIFKNSADYADLFKLVDSGAHVTAGFIPAHLMRTSVMFRRKVENVLKEPEGKALYGDAVFIQGVMRGWCKSIVSFLHSRHPKFPMQDYPAHHYVVALRQSEIGMNKRGDSGGWYPPEPVFVDIMSLMPKA